MLAAQHCFTDACSGIIAISGRYLLISCPNDSISAWYSSSKLSFAVCSAMTRSFMKLICRENLNISLQVTSQIYQRRNTLPRSLWRSYNNIHGWPSGYRLVPLTAKKAKPGQVFASRGLMAHMS